MCGSLLRSSPALLPIIYDKYGNCLFGVNTPDVSSVLIDNTDVFMYIILRKDTEKMCKIWLLYLLFRYYFMIKAIEKREQETVAEAIPFKDHSTALSLLPYINTHFGDCCLGKVVVFKQH